VRVIPIRGEGRIELDDGERQALGRPGEVDAHSFLLPPQRLRELRRQLENDELPAGLGVAEKMVTMLSACLKMPGPEPRRPGRPRKAPAASNGAPSQT
jgi:hypothetical protein